jgi:stage V sporulation protein D (sporulation-specific penicillin-binding protein)
MMMRAVIALGVLLIVGFTSGAIGIARAMIVRGETYREKAEQGQLRDVEEPAPRGEIVDSSGNVIASSTDVKRVYINPKKVNDYENKDEIIRLISEALVPILGIAEDKVAKQASYKNYSDMTLKGKVDEITMEKVNAFLDTTVTTKMKVLVKGADDDAPEEEKYRIVTVDKDAKDAAKFSLFVGSSRDTIRYYPLGTFAANVIGFTGSDDTGRTGLELYYNKQLTGTPGRTLVAKNATDSNIASEYATHTAPIKGSTLKLTIDQEVQRFLENSLEQARIDAKAKAAYGIVMDVNTGAILGMAAQASYDPAHYQELADSIKLAEIEAITDETERKKALNEAILAQWRNGAIDLTYEPGSVFKIVTVAAGLEEGVVNLNTSYTCTGAIQVENRTMHCHNRNGHGTEDLTHGLMNSCNPFMITIAQKLGVHKFYKYFDGFGFTEKTGIDLPGEAEPKPGISIHAEKDMKVVELSSCAFGQSFEASPIQVISAVSAIANGGKLMRPYVVAQVLDENGAVIEENKPTVRRQVVSEDTADKVAAMMEQVVQAGTGKNAYVAGARVAGKTGTSQKLSAGSGYVASFSCFAPADNPQVAVLIAIDDPKGQINGGQIAAPPAAEIIEQVLQHRNVPMQYTAEEEKQLAAKAPTVTGLTIAAAKELLTKADYTARVVGSGETILRQFPKAGTTVATGGVVVLYTSNDNTEPMVKVPNLVGMTVSQANAAAAAAGLNVSFSGNFASSTKITSKQSIETGAEVPAGTVITVHFVSTSGVTDSTLGED